MSTPPRGRLIALAALQANPVVHLTPEQTDAVVRGEADLTFEELGMDSMARMELSIWLELEHAIELSEREIQEIGSVGSLAALLDARQGAPDGV